MVRVCGALSSKDTAIRTPRSGEKFRHGDKIQATSTAPVVASHIWYSRQGASFGGVAVDAVTGKMVIPESVRPWSDRTSHRALEVALLRVKCSASIET